MAIWGGVYYVTLCDLIYRSQVRRPHCQHFQHCPMARFALLSLIPFLLVLCVTASPAAPQFPTDPDIPVRTNQKWSYTNCGRPHSSSPQDPHWSHLKVLRLTQYNWSHLKCFRILLSRVGTLLSKQRALSLMRLTYVRIQRTMAGI